MKLSFYADLMAATPLVVQGVVMTRTVINWNLTLPNFFRNQSDLAARGTSTWEQW